MNCLNIFENRTYSYYKDWWFEKFEKVGGKLHNGLYFDETFLKPCEKNYEKIMEVFGLLTSEEKSNQNTKKVIGFYKKYNKYPSRSDNEDENFLNNWLRDRKKTKQGKKGIFYQSDETLAIKANLPDMFVVRNLEYESNQTTIKFIEFYNQYGRVPSPCSDDKYEKYLSVWVQNKRLAKQGKGRSSWYQSDENMAIKKGLIEMFDSFEDISNKNTKKVIEFYKKYGKFPSKSGDKYEKTLNSWLCGRKTAKRKGAGYQSDENMAINAGLPDMFNKIDKKSKQLERVKQILEYYKKYNELPDRDDDNKKVKSLGMFIDTIKGIKKYPNRGTYYKKYDEILELVDKLKKR